MPLLDSWWITTPCGRAPHCRRARPPGGGYGAHASSDRTAAQLAAESFRAPPPTRSRAAAAGESITGSRDRGSGRAGGSAVLCEILDRLGIGLAEPIGFWRLLGLAQLCPVRWRAAGPAAWPGLVLHGLLAHDRYRAGSSGRRAGPRRRRVARCRRFVVRGRLPGCASASSARPIKSRAALSIAAARSRMTGS